MSKRIQIVARRPREWYENACYHIMGRGNRRAAIFKSDEDNIVFLMQLAQVKEKHPFDLHACCLMTNHFHLELTTKNEPIWKIMKPLMQNYAMWFNQRYGYVGHVFDSRYTSCLIEDDRFFLEVSLMILINLGQRSYNKRTTFRNYTDSVPITSGQEHCPRGTS